MIDKEIVNRDDDNNNNKREIVTEISNDREWERHLEIIIERWERKIGTEWNIDSSRERERERCEEFKIESR